MILALSLACAPIVTDGDTLRFCDERVRLSGIDAPEMGKCPRNRVCAPGDGKASKAHLQRLMQGKVTIERYKKDRYGRTLANVYVDGVNVACTMIRDGYAIYEARWDERGIVGRCR